MRELFGNLGWWDRLLLILVGVYLALWPFETLLETVFDARVMLQVAIYVTVDDSGRIPAETKAWCDRARSYEIGRGNGVQSLRGYPH